jgi:adenylosuccinate synthase
MTIDVILGAQWGDEGKGKLVDIQSQQAQLCCRAAGGHNAGHAIKVDGVSYDFHLLPSGLMNPKCMNFIGSGVVFHVPTFFSELNELSEKGLSAVHDRILVSDRVNVLLDMHIAVDGLEEKELGAGAIGTTKRGKLPSELHAELFAPCCSYPFTNFPKYGQQGEQPIGAMEPNFH